MFNSVSGVERKQFLEEILYIWQEPKVTVNNNSNLTKVAKHRKKIPQVFSSK